jgi:hypothetical protein
VIPPVEYSFKRSIVGIYKTVGSNKPKSETSLEAKFSSIRSSSGAVSITNESSTAFLSVNTSSTAVGLATGSRD